MFCLRNKASETIALVQNTALQGAPSGAMQPLRTHYCKARSLIENTASQKASPGGKKSYLAHCTVAQVTFDHPKYNSARCQTGAQQNEESSKLMLQKHAQKQPCSVRQALPIPAQQLLATCAQVQSVPESQKQLSKGIFKSIKDSNLPTFDGGV